MAKRKRKEKRTNNDLQNTTQEAKDRAQKIGVELGRVRSSCSTSDTRRVTLVTKPVIINESGTDCEVLR
jgi:hypothetical protein